MLISLFSLAVDNVADCGENTLIGMGIKIGDDKGRTSRTMAEKGSNQYGDTRAWNSHAIQGNLYNAMFSQYSPH